MGGGATAKGPGGGGGGGGSVNVLDFFGGYGAGGGGNGGFGAPLCLAVLILPVPSLPATTSFGGYGAGGGGDGGFGAPLFFPALPDWAGVRHGKSKPARRTPMFVGTFPCVKASALEGCLGFAAILLLLLAPGWKAEVPSLHAQQVMGMQYLLPDQLVSGCCSPMTAVAGLDRCGRLGGRRRLGRRR